MRKDRQDNRKQRREFLISSSFTAFTVLMLIVTNIERWPVFYTPVLVVEMGYVWWSYTSNFKTYLLRAYVLTALASLNIFLYGIQAEDFFVIIPTLCAEFLLLSLYELPQIMNIVIAKSSLLFLFHILIKGYTLPSASVVRGRIVLQTASYVVLMGLCLFRMRAYRQEEHDRTALTEQLSREQRIREDFIANTSHELRTPVNTVSGLSEIMLQKDLPPDIHKNMLDIQMTGAELQSIVTDILDYAALEADTIVLNPTPYNITSTLNDVMNMAMLENRAKQLEIIFDYDPNIPSQLQGDEHQLRRVLKNLVGNAIKYTQEGGITVRVSYRPEDYGINLLVSVKDTGVGMSQEDQSLILRSFYQTDMSRTRNASGLGLGLPIASALIQKMGGFLIIKSEKGVGSEFSFAIPQQVLNNRPGVTLNNPGAIKLIWYCTSSSPETAMRDAFAEHIKHFTDSFNLVSRRATSLEECKRWLSQGQTTHLILGQEEYRQDKAFFDQLSEKIFIILVCERNTIPSVPANIHVLYKPYNAFMLAEIFNGSTRSSVTVARKELKRFIAPEGRVLAVDDNLMNLKVVEGFLKKYRIQVVTATSGNEALSLIESQDFDFVFMDHMMPGMDGVECLHRIREKVGSYYAQVPIIALTANATTGSREMFLAEGFSAFVAKPIDTSLLNEVLYRFIPLEKQLQEEDVISLPQSKKPAAPPLKKPSIGMPAGNAPGEEIQDWEGIKSLLANALQTYEKRAFDQILDRVQGKSLQGKPIQETLSDVLDKVAVFDFEGALQCLEEIGGKPC